MVGFGPPSSKSCLFHWSSFASHSPVIIALRLVEQVSIERCSGARLPFADNLVNLVVAEDLDGVLFHPPSTTSEMAAASIE